MGKLLKKPNLTSESEVKHFDKLAKDYKKTHDKALFLAGGDSDHFYQAKIERIEKEFPEPPRRILDFGCGTGRLAHLLSKTFPESEIVGIDPSSESIDSARKSYWSQQKIKFDTELSAEHGTFDLIIASGVFHHIPQKLWMENLKLIEEHLSLSGKFMMFEHNKLHLGTQLILGIAGNDRDANLLTATQAKDLLVKGGLEQVEVEYVSFFPTFLKPLLGFEKYLKRVPAGAQFLAIGRKGQNKLKPIPSAGPWITEKEVSYVTDACRNGWYQNWSGYLDRFEKTIAEHLGVKYAIATSSCTGALHLAMRALDLKPDDEVIVPEISWIATVSCVKYVGAKPVFVDLTPDTWCLDPKAFEKAITPRTKAVIPVAMYGHPPEMKEILRIAKEHGIQVIEDAAPGIGSKIGDQQLGTFGLAGAFSFQGAKPLVMGEGGVLVTNDEDFYRRVYYFWDHCRDPSKVLYNSDIGFKYKLSNIQAALGLAQVERMDEIIAKRRQIFRWYEEELGEIEGLRMNVEKPGTYNNFYVPTIVLDQEFKVDAHELMQKLDAAQIANRPFFRCMSKFPMFEPAATPVADHLAANGVNLPCASMMTEEQVRYVSKFIRKEILGQ